MAAVEVAAVAPEVVAESVGIAPESAPITGELSQSPAEGNLFGGSNFNNNV